MANAVSPLMAPIIADSLWVLSSHFDCFQAWLMHKPSRGTISASGPADAYVHRMTVNATFATGDA